MLLLLQGELKEFTTNPATGQDIIGAFQNIATAHREGNHHVSGDQSVLSALHKWQHLPERARATYKKILNQKTQIGQLRKELTVYAKIVPASTPLGKKVVSGKSIIEIPITLFRRTQIIQNILLLGENKNDSELFHHLAKSWLISRKIRYPSRCFSLGGGGSAVSAVYEGIQSQSNSFCLCILDSDKKYPQAAVGDTAKGTIKIDNEAKPLSTVEVIGCREVENLIPTRVFQEVISNFGDKSAISSIQLLNELDKEEMRKFIELKEKTTIGHYLVSNNASMRAYWERTIPQLPIELSHQSCQSWGCCNKEDCKCSVFPGLGKNILAHVVNYLKLNSPHKNKENFWVDDGQKAIRVKIGELVASWSIGAPTSIT